MPIKLKGYNTFQTNRNTAILVEKKLAVCHHDEFDSDTPHEYVDIHPAKRRGRSLHILNVYSSTSNLNPNLDYLIKPFLTSAGRGARVIVAGDFNAHNGVGLQTNGCKRREVGRTGSHGTSRVTNQPIAIY